MHGDSPLYTKEDFLADPELLALNETVKDLRMLREKVSKGQTS